MLAPLLLAAALAPARASDEFLSLMHKAESRKEMPDRAEYFDRAIKAWQPEDGQELLAHCHLRRGEARYELFAFQEAEPDLSKAVELDPGSARAYYLRGRIRARDGRLDAALADLKEYALIKDEDVEGWLAVGDAQAKLSRWDAALEAYKRAEQLDPADFRVALGQARVWMARKDWPRAHERLDAADEASRHRAPEVFLERAVCGVAVGQTDQALEDYTKALPLFDRKLEDLKRSRAHPVAVQEMREKAAHAYYGRGRLNEFLVRLHEAADDYQTACELGHKQACERLASVKQYASKEATATEAPREKQKDAAKVPEAPKEKKRRRLPRADSDPGDRIYAN
jgi:tetratricopeptide (TPR) repeat protein